jgi:hypothetical protein
VGAHWRIVRSLAHCAACPATLERAPSHSTPLQRRHCEASNSGQVPLSEARVLHILSGSKSLRSAGANATNTGSENKMRGKVGLSCENALGPR